MAASPPVPVLPCCLSAANKLPSAVVLAAAILCRHNKACTLPFFYLEDDLGDGEIAAA
jgi:hypothetical protein